MFFADATPFANRFDYLHAPKKLVIDLTHAHFWDLSAVGALDRVVLKLRAHGAEVEVIGLNEASDTLIERGSPVTPGSATWLTLYTTSF